MTEPRTSQDRRPIFDTEWILWLLVGLAFWIATDVSNARFGDAVVCAIGGPQVCAGIQRNADAKAAADALKQQLKGKR